MPVNPMFKQPLDVLNRMAKGQQDDTQQTIYNQVVSSFGTHYITSVVMGGSAKIFTSINSEYLKSFDYEQVRNQVSIDFIYTVFKFKFGSDTTYATQIPNESFKENSENKIIFSPEVDNLQDPKAWSTWESQFPQKPQPRMNILEVQSHLRKTIEFYLKNGKLPFFAEIQHFQINLKEQTQLIPGADIVKCGFDSTSLEDKRCIFDLDGENYQWSNPNDSSIEFTVPEILFVKNKPESFTLNGTAIFSTFQDFVKKTFWETRKHQFASHLFCSQLKPKPYLVLIISRVVTMVPRSSMINWARANTLFSNLTLQMVKATTRSIDKISRFQWLSKLLIFLQERKPNAKVSFTLSLISKKKYSESITFSAGFTISEITPSLNVNHELDKLHEEITQNNKAVSVSQSYWAMYSLTKAPTFLMPLNPMFKQSLDALNRMARNPQSDTQQTIYNQVFNSFGTHFVTSVIMGGAAKIYTIIDQGYLKTLDFKQIKIQVTLDVNNQIFKFKFGYDSTDITQRPSESFKKNSDDIIVFFPEVDHLQDPKAWATWESKVPMKPQPVNTTVSYISDLVMNTLKFKLTQERLSITTQRTTNFLLSVKLTTPLNLV
ncbi:hypothetical protein ABPG72_016166 [Tetrahymena utriculariae]